jgi:hypothetical protein
MNSSVTDIYKVADNTFVNIVPITTGKFVKELPWTEDMKNVPFDKYDFIWKKYSQHGYRTLYSEDAPGILSTGFYSLVDSGVCWDICLKTSQGRLET